MGRPLRTHYANEVALRLLLSLIALTAARLGIAISPLFAHANLHYMRIYVKVSISNSQANNVYDNIGYFGIAIHAETEIQQESIINQKIVKYVKKGTTWEVSYGQVGCLTDNL